jgi:hypothetical protein
MKWMVAAMMAVIPTGAAYATEGVVVGDAYVNSAHPAMNYGSLSNLYVNSNGTALIQFDLSSLPAGTTASQIGAASLKVYVNRVNTSGLVSVLPVTSAWSESTVTYSTIPTLGSTVASFTPAAAQQFIVIDITSLVQSWVTTPSSNYGIALTTSSGDLVLDSKENDETSHAAHLDITVVSQGPPGTPGANGAAATISLGSTTTGAAGSSASVTNTGTSSAAVLNFTIPEGAVGATPTIGIGSTTTGAAGSNASVTISGTASAPQLNFSIPQGAAGVVQSIAPGTVANTATPGAGMLTVSNGATANPTINVNFPNDVQSVSIGSVTNSGSTGTFTFDASSTATKPKFDINFPALSNNATGAIPSGIPYTVTGHGVGTSIEYASVAGTSSSTSIASPEVALVPTACTPSFTIYSWVPSSITFTLMNVIPDTETPFSAGSAISGASCTTSAWTMGSPETCTATASGSISALTLITLEASAASANAIYVLAFSCQ